jgi:hypothetical protein
MDDDSFKQEELEERLKAAEADLAELLESIEEPLEKPEDSGYLVIDQEFRQVIVHWVPQEEVSSIADETEARDKFVQAIEDRDQIDATRKGDRVVGHGDLMIIHDASEDCNWICYVARVDRTDAYNVGFQGEAPEAGYAKSQQSNGEVMRELIVWSTCTGEGGGDPCSHAHPTESVTVPVITGGTISVPKVSQAPVVDLFKQTSVSTVIVPTEFEIGTTSTPININSGSVQVSIGTKADEYQIEVYQNPVKWTADDLVINVQPTTETVRLPTDDQTVSIGTSFAGVTSDTRTQAEGLFSIAQPAEYVIKLKEIQVSLCSGGQSTTVTLYAKVEGNEPAAGYLISNKNPNNAEVAIPKFDVSIWSTDTVSIAKNWSPQSIVTDVEYGTAEYVKAIVSLGPPTVFDVLKNLRADGTEQVATQITGTANVDLPTSITPVENTKVSIFNRVGTTEDASKVTIDASHTEAVIVLDGTEQAAGAAEPCVSVYNPT